MWKRRITSEFSYIILKTNITGNVKLFSEEYTIFPDEIYINSINQSEIKKEYYLVTLDNNITLIWYDQLTTTSYMFYNCKDITEIDLSIFDSSETNKMNSMFRGCSSLISLYLANFETSQVTDMNSMFKGCSSLTSLDLSSFNTSNVISMNNMFYECSSLTSLDLSNFQTSN